MTKVRKSSETAKLAQIINDAIDGITRDVKQMERASYQRIITIFWQRLSKLQDDTEDVIRASLREEAADGTIPPKNGGSFQTGGEHGAGDECGLKEAYRDEEHINKCAFKTKDGKCIRRIKSCVYTQD